MTDLNAALHAAVMGALLLLDTDDDIELADAILAAVNGVLDEHSSVEWALRHPDGEIKDWRPPLLGPDRVGPPLEGL